ncbi:hypothetical protein A1O3_04422 [Capronia epimyces CBS 606.96]|uniref:Uncharacterized protein n=1 Tax=Capronia epimyces CBS 606.96 TaxID=1182542 RepID=W9Y3T3_9EURO|nr:uncharacterized protein A1O3_04422 [Capronia epimyces CBS 606.96]EXJ87462.1 hypothetical protein A1O3_04422 [Capronia epimyces CBS 606.96]
MARFWTTEEITELSSVLDGLEGQGITTSGRAASVAVDHFKSLSPNVKPFTKEQISNKILSLARNIRLKSASDLVQNWNDHQAQVLALAKKQAPDGANRPSNLKLNFKRKRKRSSQVTLDISSEDEDEENWEGGSDSLSEAASDKTLEQYYNEAQGTTRDPIPLEGSTTTPTSPTEDATVVVHTNTHTRTPRPSLRLSDPVEIGESSPPALTCLDPAEESLIKCIRNPSIYRGWEANPSENFVDRAMDKILQKMAAAIQCFYKAIPTTGLTVSRLTADASDLSSLLFNCGVAKGAELDRFLTVLFNDPALSTDLVLQVYAAVAVTEWVFQRFNGEVDRELKVVLQTLSEHAPAFARKLATSEKMKHLEKSVKPRMPRLAESLQVKLLDIFLSLRTARQAAEAASAGPSVQDRVDHLARWELKANQAFEEALDLRLMMEQSVCPYSFRWAVLGDPFDKAWMESAHKGDEAPPQDTSVLVSLRPAIYSRSRSAGSESLLVVPALVMLQGFGAPCELKIDFGSIRC